MSLYLIRHGETEWSLSGKHTSRTDIPLTVKGEAAARNLAARLKPIAFDVVLTSPRERARKTCELAGLSATARIEPLLTEWDYGDVEGLLTTEIIKSCPGWNLFRDGSPNGESPAQITQRADQLLSQLHSLKGNIALFTHGHFGAALATRWIALPVEKAQHFPLSTASISILSIDERHQNTPVITRWNET
ncbi:MAG: putative phosphoglycerate mutase [Verrucomicrobiales bacterium]|nr:putative phosphoglycerate mutase [Verrucomicrobiales bacterium]